MVIARLQRIDLDLANVARIETLLEEAYNERMHLLTFLKMAEPGWFMRLMILGAQGVFYNVRSSPLRSQLLMTDTNDA